jgi:putative colanic acid biosysnthesis UDP-glucose lipid carrier transferase
MKYHEIYPEGFHRHPDGGSSAFAQKVLPDTWPCPESFLFRVVKRGMDIGISLFAVLFILSWLLPLLSLLILLDIGPPVFFVQDRIGRYNRRFRCLKLRTMRAPAASPSNRITRMGRLMRNHKLDELPQFINVLRGDMSVIGPRPHMLSDHEAFSAATGKRYHLRHAVRPGISGLAQVRGYEGAVTSYRKLHGRLRLDLFYVRRWSLRLEFYIIFQTLRLVLLSRR